jgi:hypothetical protein
VAVRLHEAFNQTALSRFLNRPAGRVFRIVSGLGFLGVGLLYRHTTPGLAAMIWGIFPLSAGAFDVCYISAALGGPFRGAKIREMFGAVGAALLPAKHFGR